MNKLISQAPNPAFGSISLLSRSGLWVFILCIAAASIAAETITNAPPRWPKLADVLARWDATEWEAVQKAAEGGELTAQHYLGYCLTEGHRVAQDSVSGIGWYVRAGNAGYSPALNNLAIVYEVGKGVPRDLSKTVLYARQAADLGYVPALTFLGNLYRNGNGVQRDYHQAMNFYQQAAERGHPPALAAIGQMYLDGLGVQQNPSEAHRWFEKGVEHGDALAEFRLGLLSEQEGDPVAALKWLQKAADHGRADAMFKLYLMYRFGSDGTRNFQEGRRWLIRAAEAGNASAQCELGYLFEHPAPEDASNPARKRYLFEAVKWYRRAAERNEPAAQQYLGNCYLKGNGLEQDEEIGLKWMRLAADNGSLQALRTLAELYESGVGEPRSVNETPIRIWQHIATAPGDDEYSARIAYSKVVFRYQYGFGTPQDLVAAVQWYCRAGIAGVEGFELLDPLHAASDQATNAVFLAGPDSHVSHHPEYRNSFSQEFRLILSMYLRAADHNDSGACEHIARMYASGQNVTKDSARAWVWFRMAEDRGSSVAKSKAAVLARDFTHDELQQNQRIFSDLGDELRRLKDAISTRGNSKQ